MISGVIAPIPASNSDGSLETQKWTLSYSCTICTIGEVDTLTPLIGCSSAHPFCSHAHTALLKRHVLAYRLATRDHCHQLYTLAARGSKCNLRSCVISRASASARAERARPRDLEDHRRGRSIRRAAILAGPHLARRPVTRCEAAPPPTGTARRRRRAGDDAMRCGLLATGDC